MKLEQAVNVINTLYIILLQAIRYYVFYLYKHFNKGTMCNKIHLDDLNTVDVFWDTNCFYMYIHNVHAHAFDKNPLILSDTPNSKPQSSLKTRQLVE